MSPAPAERGSGLCPLFLILLLVIVVLFDEPNPNGFSTTPTPSVPLPVDVVVADRHVVTADVEDPGAGRQQLEIVFQFDRAAGRVFGFFVVHTGGNGFGRLFIVTLFSSIIAFSVEDFGRPGRTITKIPAVLPVTLFLRTIVLSVLSSSIPISAFVSLLRSTRTPLSTPT